MDLRANANGWIDLARARAGTISKTWITDLYYCEQAERKTQMATAIGILSKYKLSMAKYVTDYFTIECHAEEHMKQRRKNEDEAALGCVVYALLGLLFMPIVGLFLACGKDPEKRTLGWILLIVGIVLWIVLGIGSA